MGAAEELFGRDLFGMNHLYVWISGKPCLIESQDGSEPMREHCGNQTSIMRWFARYLVLDYEGFPERIYRGSFR